MNAFGLFIVLTIVSAMPLFGQTCPSTTQFRNSSRTIDGRCNYSVDINQGDQSIGVSTLTIPEGDTLYIGGDFNIYDDVDIFGVVMVTNDVNVGSLLATAHVYVGPNGSFIVGGNYNNGGDGFLFLPLGPGDTDVDGHLQVAGEYNNNNTGTTNVSDTGTLESGTFNYNGGTVTIVDGTAADCETGCCGEGCTPLPVVMLEFNAKEDNQNACLSWTTSKEWDNDYFVVQKMTTGDTWETIGIVAGKGTTDETTSYSITDFSFQEDSYYQITQVDFDGNSEVFGPIVLTKNSTQSNLEVYPNPTTGPIKILGSGYRSFTLSDIEGKVICRETNRIGKEAEEIINSCLQDKHGTFVLTFNGNNSQIVKRILKQ